MYFCSEKIAFIMKKVLVFATLALFLASCQESLEERCAREAKEYTAEEFRAILAAGGTAEFASDNVLVSFDENGKMIWIERIYSALQ